MSAVSIELQNAEYSAPCLVADIGGTNARFSIAQHDSNQSLRLQHPKNYRVEQFNTIAAALLDYLQTLPAGLRPMRAVLAVASAVTQDTIQFTKSPWSFSKLQLQQQLGLAQLHVINDFAAVAWALPALSDSELEPIGEKRLIDIKKPGVYAALGPGTGLGVAALKIDQDFRVSVIETEGGHISYAPSSEDEIKILQFLQKEFSRVSYERLLCGSGLVNLYRARSSLLKLSADLKTPAEVSAAAKSNLDPAARLAASDFCRILGAFAGDVTLMFGAWSGVYLTGGLLPHLLNQNTHSSFRKAFEDKGRFSNLLQQTPVQQIQRSDVGNLGAANFALQTKNQTSAYHQTDYSA
jgi:glucokinase